MPSAGNDLCFQQIHIDVARNATDDFNPFHDPGRWSRVEGNPFSGPIVLGFQLEGLVAEHMRQYRLERGENELQATEALHHSNFEFRFVGAVRPGQRVSLEVKPSRWKSGDEAALSNRVSISADEKLALTGYKRETIKPLYLANSQCLRPRNLARLPDRTFLEGGELFLKRKFINTGSAKNFLCACLVEQSHYIDELAEKVNIPELFPCSLISCSLLERAWAQGHDFERKPLVYQSHALSIDRRVLAEASSNDTLHLLNRPAGSAGQLSSYEVYGILGSDSLLFRGRIDLAALITD